MSEMVDRVADAIWNAIDDVRTTADPCVPSMEFCQLAARAAIAALRKPTSAMIDALNSYAVCAGYIEEGWAAAMDEALK